MNRRNRTIAWAGAILLPATIAILLLCIKDWDKMAFTSAAFILWAQASFFASLFLTEQAAQHGEPLFLRPAFLVLSSFYACSAFILSLVFLNLFRRAYTAFWVMQTLLLAAFGILLLVIYAVSRGIRASHRNTMQSVTWLEALMQRLDVLALSEADQELASIIRSSSEQLRYTDLSVLVPADKEIDETVSRLEFECQKDGEARSGQTCNTMLATLESLIARRGLEASLTKEGGI